VELALAGGSHTEIARVVVNDVDLASCTVQLGARRTRIDAFAVATIQARIASCRRIARRSEAGWDQASVSLALARPLAAYPPTSVAPSISSSLSRAMRAAGLTRTGLRPASLREFAANRCYALESRVESVADFLGIPSLDAARGLIDEDWQHQFGEEVRASDRA